MTCVKIRPGNCGYETLVTAHTEDMQNARITLESGCSAVMRLAEALGGELDAYSACLTRPGMGPVFDTAREIPIHACCPVLPGLIKCVEAECGLTLPQNASIEFVS